MPPKPKKVSLRLDDLAFYFDSVERDRLDATGTSRKSGEVLALRESLVKLPDEQFDAAIQTLRAFVSAQSAPRTGDDASAKRQKARELFDGARGGARGGGGGGTGKVSPA